MNKNRFIAWDKKTKKMIKNNVIVVNDITTVKLGVSGSSQWIVDVNPDYVPLQFTGLEDINDNEIYEGYLVNVINVTNDTGGSIYVVKYLFGGFKAYRKGCDLLDLVDIHYKCEIVGTMFEDKQLLEEI